MAAKLRLAANLSSATIKKPVLYLLEVEEQEARGREILPLQAIRIEDGNSTKIGKTPKQQATGLYDANV